MTRDHAAENARRRQRYGADAEYRSRVRAYNRVRRIKYTMRDRIVREARLAALFETHFARIRALPDPPEPDPTAHTRLHHHEGCDCGPHKAVAT